MQSNLQEEEEEPMATQGLDEGDDDDLEEEEEEEEDMATQGLDEGDEDVEEEEDGLENYGIAYDLCKSTIAMTVRNYDQNNNIQRNLSWYNGHQKYYACLTRRLQQLGYSKHQQSLWKKRTTFLTAYLEASTLHLHPDLFWLTIPGTVESVSVVRMEVLAVY